MEPEYFHNNKINNKKKKIIIIIIIIIITIIIIIIIMNFYSPVSNTRCHSIGHKMRIARIKNPGRQFREKGKSLERECNFEEVCFEPGTEDW